MSEYQYYEFQAVDRPLSREEMAKLRTLSTRAQISPNRFVNEYQWGDFKGKPRFLLEKYFDGFVYLANWGTHRFMLRIPDSWLSAKVAGDYVLEPGLNTWSKAGSLHFEFQSTDENGEWVEGAQEWLPTLISLRNDLRQGDLRALYLGWLAAVNEGHVEDGAVEPPVPPGLGELTPPLEALADFLRIDADLITAGAEGNPGKMGEQPSPFRDLRVEVAVRDRSGSIVGRFGSEQVPEDLAREILHRLRGKLSNRNVESFPGLVRSGRTVGQIRERATALLQERKKREAVRKAREKVEREAAAKEKRQKHLASLRGLEKKLWEHVDAHIATRNPGEYDEAVEILKDLRDLAGEKGAAQFSSALRRLCATHSKKTTLMERLRKAGLSE